MPRAPCSCMRFSSASLTLRIDDHDGARRRPDRGDRVEGRGVLGAIGRGLHDDIAAGADTLLELAIILDRGVARPQCRARIDLVLRAVDVMVAVAGIGRRLELRRFGAARPFDLLRGGVAHSVRRRMPRARAPADAALSRSRRLQELAAIGSLPRPISARVASGRVMDYSGKPGEITPRYGCDCSVPDVKRIETPRVMAVSLSHDPRQQVPPGHAALSIRTARHERVPGGSGG